MGRSTGNNRRPTTNQRRGVTGGEEEKVRAVGDIDRVLALVNPKAGYEPACRRDAETSIRLIESATAYNIGAIKRHIATATAALERARRAVDVLPPGTRDVALLTALEVAQRRLTRREKMVVVKRSGGSIKAKDQFVKKEMAAARAFDLLNDWSGHRVPTTTKPGPWLELSALLYELATGIPDADVERVATLNFSRLYAPTPKSRSEICLQQQII